jgi:hypothetical protein
LALAVPAVTVAPLAGDVVEEVRFLRDEMANLVWGVEQIVTDDDGNWRDLPEEHVRARVRAEVTPANAAVAYQVDDGGSRRLGAVHPRSPHRQLPASRTCRGGAPSTEKPRRSGDRVAAIKRPQELRDLVLPEEEVPSAGIVVRRRWFLARSADGGRHAWAARSVTTCRGEGASDRLLRAACNALISTTKPSG